MADAVTQKDLRDLISTLDKRIENQVNSGLLKHLSLKLQLLSIVVAGIIASIAVHAVVLTYVNDKVIASSIKEATAHITEDIKALNTKLDKLLSREGKPKTAGHSVKKSPDKA